jgi:hypothetical protein
MSKNRHGAFTRATWPREQLVTLEKVGATRRCDRSFLAMVSPLNIAPKKTFRKFRLTVNLRHVNAGLIFGKFCFEKIDSLIGALERGDLTVAYDLKDDYYHFALHPSTFPYMGLEFDGAFHYFCVLPFGFEHVPLVFKKAMRELVGMW